MGDLGSWVELRAWFFVLDLFGFVVSIRGFGFVVLSAFFFFVDLHLLLLLLSAFFVASGFRFVVFVFFTATSLNFVHYGN